MYWTFIYSSLEYLVYLNIFAVIYWTPAGSGGCIWIWGREGWAIATALSVRRKRRNQREPGTQDPPTGKHGNTQFKCVISIAHLLGWHLSSGNLPESTGKPKLTSGITLYACFFWGWVENVTDGRTDGRT